MRLVRPARRRVLSGDVSRSAGRPGPVVAVLGGSGGVGASSFAAVLAWVAGPSVLIDFDAAAGGIDVLLGIERQPGARWSEVQVDGGHLDPQDLVTGLPRWGPCAVLAADGGPVPPDSAGQVVAVAAGHGPVVLDLGRQRDAAGEVVLGHCDLVVVLGRADVLGAAGAHTAVAALPDLPVGLVLRRGPVPGREVAAAIGAPLLGELPPVRGAGGDPSWRRLPRAGARLAAGLLDGVRAGERAVAGSGASW
jgi:hypothetical protein